jgi:hypothetical protein
MDILTIVNIKVDREQTNIGPHSLEEQSQLLLLLSLPDSARLTLLHL